MHIGTYVRYSAWQVTAHNLSYLLSTPLHERESMARKISKVGDTSSGVLACPKCGGVNPGFASPK